MPLFSSRNTNYNVGDPVKSADLNDMQDKIVDLHQNKHGQLTRVINPELFARISGWTLSSAFPYADLAPSTSGLLYVPLPVEVGERIISCSIIASSNNGVTSDIQASLRRINGAVGSSSPGTETTIVAATNLPAAVATLQKTTLTPASPETVLATAHYYMRVNGASSAGSKQVVRAEVVVDRP